jgi:hypothetical protein
MKHSDAALFWRLILPLACLACDFSNDGLGAGRVQPGAMMPGTGGGRGNSPPIYPPNFPPPIDDPIPGVYPPDAPVASPDAIGLDGIGARDAGAGPDAGRPADAGVEVSPPPGTPPTAVEPPTQPPPAPPTIDCPDDNRLRLCMRFERNLRNESPNDLMVNGDQISYESGLPGAGTAVRIGNGTDIRISNTGGAVNITTFTVEAWIRLDRLPAGGDRATVVDRQGRYSMAVLPDGAVACGNGPHRVVSPPGAVAAGVWLSLACTANNQEVAVWVDGTSRARADAGPNNAASNLGGLSIARTQTNDDPMSGLLDNVRLWDHVRQPQQICAAAIGCR